MPEDGEDGARFAGVAESLAAIRRSIARAEAEAGRPSGSVTLVAVSKTVPAEGLAAALAAGQRVFGENRVQEAKAKWPAKRADHPDLELHLIGPLQTNKAGDAVGLFDCIESLDRPKLAKALASEMRRQGRVLDVYVQVNTGDEAQKAGIAPAEADRLIGQARDLGLKVEGLMCIPPLEDDPAPHFALLAEIARRNGLAKLSMGMSGDYEAAIAAGATHVRIGTAIFGARG